MAQQSISITPPLTWEKFGGETQSIFAKINDNFTELYLSIGGSGADLTALGSSLIPDFDEDHDLGSPSKKWNNIYVSSTGLHIGTAVITSNLNAVDLPAGSTVDGNAFGIPSNLVVDSIELLNGASVDRISTDATFSVNVDDSTLSTKLAIKTYLDNEIPTDVNELSDVDNLLVGLSSRTDISDTATSLVVDGSVTLILTGFKAYGLLKIQTDVAAWVRVYTDLASQSADLTRLITDDPLPGAGIIAEAITNGTNPVLMSPSIIGFNNDSPVSQDVYVTVTNKSLATADVTVTLTILKLEV